MNTHLKFLLAGLSLVSAFAAQAQSNVQVGYGFNSSPRAASPTDPAISQSLLNITPDYTSTGTTLKFAYDAMDSDLTTANDGLITWTLKAANGFSISEMNYLSLAAQTLNMGGADGAGWAKYQLWGAVGTNPAVSSFSLLSAGTISGVNTAATEFSTTGTENFNVFDNLGTGTANFRLLLADTTRHNTPDDPEVWGLNQLVMQFKVAPIAAPTPAVPEPSTAMMAAFGAMGLLMLRRRANAEKRA